MQDNENFQEQPHFSQLCQDLWVVGMTGGKRNGTFLEIGSSDGVELNNTYLLERDFGWRGVCVEANPNSFKQLAAARSATCIQKAVWKTSGDIVELVGKGVLGAIVDVAFEDVHATRRREHAERVGTIKVETISVPDLMLQAKLPSSFDYLSLDVEGAEVEVMKNFDLTKYRFALASIEHNHHPNRKVVADMLAAHGYERVQVKFEDWFWNPAVFAELNMIPVWTARLMFQTIAAKVHATPKRWLRPRADL